MKSFALLPLVLGVLALFAFRGSAQAQDDHDHDHDHDHKSCACLAEENGWTIDCTDQTSMLAALPVLQQNGCIDDCSSPRCRKAFFTIQAHHDFCFDPEVPEEVEDALHLYESVCEECYVNPKTDPSKPMCPSVICESEAGNDAYGALVSNGCVDDCSSDLCGQNFRTMVSFHDSCPEDSLSQAAEMAFHELEEVCAAQECNVVDAPNVTSPVCERSSTDTLRSVLSFASLLFLLAATFLAAAI